MQGFIHRFLVPVRPVQDNVNEKLCPVASIKKNPIDDAMVFQIISSTTVNLDNNISSKQIWLSESAGLTPRLTRILGKTDPIARPAAVRRCEPPSLFVHAALSLVANTCAAGKRSPFSSLLYPYATPVQAIQGCYHFPSDHCNARRFSDLTVGAYFMGLFRQASYLASADLSRFDLHHAHFFYDSGENALGLLFHAREYPAFGDMFPYFLGRCQFNSTLRISSDTDMGLRTVLWLFGENVLILLDSTRRIPFGTIYESEFGQPIADLFFFDGCRGKPQERINRGLYIVSFKE